MAKQERSARELAERGGAANWHWRGMVAVHPDPAYGWHPVVVTAPAAAIDAQLAAEHARTSSAAISLELGENVPCRRRKFRMHLTIRSCQRSRQGDCTEEV
jgi:hypothetical protein